MNDEEIVSGFRSLHAAIAEGFARVDKRFEKVEAGLLDVRNDISRLEHRMLRRFDDVDERLDSHERRISALEARRA